MSLLYLKGDGLIFFWFFLLCVGLVYDRLRIEEREEWIVYLSFWLQLSLSEATCNHQFSESEWWVFLSTSLPKKSGCIILAILPLFEIVAATELEYRTTLGVLKKTGVLLCLADKHGC